MWKSPSSVSRNYGKEFSIWWSSIWSQPSNSSCKPKHTTSRKSILSTIRCKNNESLPQSGNDKTENIQNILARRSWMDYSPGICFQTILVNTKKIKSTHQEQSTGKKQIRIKEDGADVAPSSTYELPQMIALWGFLIKRPKDRPWEWGYLYPRYIRQQNMYQHSRKKIVWW